MIFIIFDLEFNQDISSLQNFEFEKMYARKITLEEQEMIELAYKMGKTNQFSKEVLPEPNNRS